MTNLEDYIQSYFGIIDQEELSKISSLFKLTTIKKGEFLLKKDKLCKHLTFIQSGLLRMFSITDGKEVTQWISSDGYFALDLASFIYKTPSRWSIQALVDTQIYSINKEDYDTIGQIVLKWNEIEKLFIIKCFIVLEDRIYSHLSMTAEERYEYFFNNNSELFNLVPLKYIASILGMTPETFSRIRRKQME